MSSNTSESSPTFEIAYQRLEEIARELDDESTSLEQSFNLYEEGQRLIKQCQDMLDQAEKRLNIVKLTDGGYETTEERIE